MKKKNYRCDFLTAIKWCRNSYIMLNNIHELDDMFFYNLPNLETEYFQYFLSDVSECELEYLTSRFPELQFAYSEKLGHYVLCVDHYGTSWDNVFTDIAKRKDESEEEFKQAVEIIKNEANNFSQYDLFEKD